MIPAILGLGGLTAKIIASAVIPRVVRAISSSFSTTKANEPCPPPAVEGISSVSDTPPVPPGSGVFVPRESLRKWGYAGLWHHQASGLDLATYRAYDAANKRWISRDPLGEGSDRTLYSYCWNNPINAVDPSGLGPGSEPGPDFDPNITVTRWVFGSEETRDDFLEFTAWTLATELGLRFIARAAGGSARCKTPTKNPFDAARRGDTVHYDELNGRPGTQSGPTAIQSKYPDTEFQFAKQGEKGVDVRVVGGKMPWDYQGSNWPKGVRTADIKPGNANGFQTFMKEMKNGKIPAGSIPLPYNTDTLKVHVP